MSERSVSENRKLWEAAEKAAEKAVAEAKEKSAEEKRKQKKRVVKLGLMSVLVALVLILASVAWFAANDSVVADTMAIQANGNSFDIATKKEKVSYKDQLIEADGGYQEGTTQELNNEDGGTDDYYVHSSTKLILRCDANSKGTGDKDIRPGGNGELDLYMVAKNSGSLSASIKVKVIPYTVLQFPDIDEDTKQQKVDEDGNKLYITRLQKTAELNLENTAGSQLEGKDLTKYQAAARYLCGHILFFKNPGDTDEETPEGERYYYDTPFTYNAADMSWTSNFSKSNVSAGTAYKVPVQWMWTNTLGQMALTSSVDGKRKGYPVAKDGSADQTAVINYLKSNKANIFKPLTEGSTTITVNDNMITNASTDENFRILSESYNNADFDIGTCVNYFMIEVTIDKG